MTVAGEAAAVSEITVEHQSVDDKNDRQLSSTCREIRSPFRYKDLSVSKKKKCCYVYHVV